ncbi:hypothetical protein SEPCBS57363_000073 [Sporothrix epigloea]|uniref:Uncharacterized protein n=1 Tax=Sporothrix epigloea TaxID=1892477 RepID=A0ABP0D3P8_9PEZI
MSRRRVVFRDSSSPSDESTRYLSDSAGGRYSSGHNGSERTEHGSLQKKYQAMLAELDECKALADSRRSEVKAAKKLASEAEAMYRAMAERNEQMEDEKKKLFRENKDLKSQIKGIEELQDTIHDLNEQLAKSNARINELQPSIAPQHHLHADARSPTSKSRHSKDGLAPSTSSKGSSTASSGTSSSSATSHSSSHAKVGSSNSCTSGCDIVDTPNTASNAKLSRSSSRHDHHVDKGRFEIGHRTKEDNLHSQRNRLTSRFAATEPNDSHGLITSDISPSSQKHKNRSSGDGSSGNIGSKPAADIDNKRPSNLRTRRGSYVEGHGPGMLVMTRNPAPNTIRSPQLPGMLSAAGVVPESSYFGGHCGYVQPAQPAQYGMPHSSAGLAYPRGGVVNVAGDANSGSHYYAPHTSALDPRDPRIQRQ